MNQFQRHECKDCGDPLYWDDQIRSTKTGNRIPLNEDYETPHYKTCVAREQNQPGPKGQGRPVPPIITKSEATATDTETAIKQDVILARLDRLDQSMAMIVGAMEKLTKYFLNEQRLNEEEMDEARRNDIQ